jgi:DNA processing protein
MAYPRACLKCLRRTWLLGKVAPYLERSLRDEAASKIPGVLALPDDYLVEEIAGETAAHVLARVESIPDRRFDDQLHAAKCWATCRHDDFYPDALRTVPAPPAALLGRGDPELLVTFKYREAVTIAGARRATAYGREVARRLGRDCAEMGLTVVSGLAFGIDACAHRGAIEAGRTIAVMPCGPDLCYPAAHRSLWRRICESGLVVSELPPGSSAWRWTFPARNRIMAALSAMTVVVEAAERSGSMLTVDAARASHRLLGAVPGPVGSRVSAGPNRLLANGAHVVRDVQDIFVALFGDGCRPGHREP